MDEQQQELALMEKWAWTSTAGFEPIHDLPWESAADIASAEQDLPMAVGDDELKASNLDAQSDCQWQCKDAFLASLSQQQNGCDVRDAAPQAAFHLSSDGSTWDQSGNVVAAGVDWDQYDEEVSGQASLMFVEKKKEALDGEQDIELINGSQHNEEHNVWESGNSVAFPKAVDELVPNVPQQQPDFQWNLHAPEFQFRPSTDRKLSATELLVKSSSDAELAVLLAAANDDPDGEMDVDDVMSPRYDNFGDPLVVHGSNGDVEAEEVDSEEEDWTFHRGAGQDNEESAVDSEPTESSLLKEAEADKVIEVCNSATCQADELGGILERLAVDDAETTEVVKPIQLDLSEDRNLNSSEEQRIEDVISTFAQSSPHENLVGSQEGVPAGESGLVPEKVELVTNIVSGDNVVMEEDSDVAVPVGGQSVGAEDGPLMQNQPVCVEDIPLSEQNESDPFPAGEVPVPVSDPMFLVEEQIPVQNIAAQPREEPTLVVKESVESTGSREWRQSLPLEIAKSTSILEQVSVAEPTTVVEEAPALSEEAAPVVEEVPVAETAPVVEEASAAEAVPVVEEAPAAEVVPVEEETPAVEAFPVVEEILVAGAAPVGKETTMVDVLLEKTLVAEAAPIEAGVDDSALPVESNVVAVENEQLCQPPSPISDAGATIGSDSVAAVAIAAVATALVSGVVAPAGRASPTKKTTTVKAAPVKEPAKKAETTRRPPAESKTDVKPTRPTKLSPLRKAAPASPKPMVKKVGAAPKTTSLPPKLAVPLATTKAPVPPRPTSTLTPKPTTLVKKTTTTFNAARPTAATSAKKVTATTTVTTESHTTTSAPISKTSITKTATVTATRVVSAAVARKASPTVNGTGRPTSAPLKPAAAVNGDVKGKSIVSTTRTVTKTVTSTATVDAASTKATTTKVFSLAPRPTMKSTTASPIKSASSTGPSKAPPTPASRVAKDSTAGTSSPTKILKE